MDTFIVRIWRPATSDGEPAPGAQIVRGFVEHSASGRKHRFNSPIELLGLLMVDDYPEGSGPLSERRNVNQAR
jgi:hypothetical protein